jgi:hypothetical protein
VLVEFIAVACCIIGQAIAGAEIKAPKATVASKSFFMARSPSKAGRHLSSMGGISR